MTSWAVAILLEPYEIRVNGIADGITEMTNKNGIGIKYGILRNWTLSGLKFRFREKIEHYSAKQTARDKAVATCTSLNLLRKESNDNT